MEPTPKERHLWSREEYDRMIAGGVFDRGARVELIDGEIIEMSPQGSRHLTAVVLAEMCLRRHLPDDAHIRIQMPLGLDDRSVPEPDLAVVRGSPREYRDRHPATALLVVEVAERTLPLDRELKSRLYARNGIPEYWIVDLVDGRLEVRTKPAGDRYGNLRVAGAGESITSGLIARPEVAVSDLLP